MIDRWQCAEFVGSIVNLKVSSDEEVPVFEVGFYGRDRHHVFRFRVLFGKQGQLFWG